MTEYTQESVTMVLIAMASFYVQPAGEEILMNYS